MCAFTWESAPVPWLFTTNTTLIHYFDFKSKHCCLKCFYPCKSQNPGVKYKFLGGVLLVRFVFQGLNIKLLEANRGLRNTVACQIDAFSEDCLDVFDLKQRCKTDRCEKKKKKRKLFQNLHLSLLPLLACTCLNNAWDLVLLALPLYVCLFKINHFMYSPIVSRFG